MSIALLIPNILSAYICGLISQAADIDCFLINSLKKTITQSIIAKRLALRDKTSVGNGTSKLGKERRFMMYDFNADDIFEMAEQMERNGAKFYRAAAASVDDQEAKSFLLGLAAMEEEHEKTFADMRSRLSSHEKAPTVFDPQNEAGAYLRALVETRVFFEKELDTSDLRTILKDAITAEKDAIVFYLGMRDAVPDALGRTHLDEIIREEMGHIRLLGRELVASK